MKYFDRKFRWNVFLVSFIILLILAFVVFMFAFGYDEGTMRNEFFGKLFTAIITVFSYPSQLLITPFLKGDIYFLQGKLYLLFLLMYLFNITLYSILIEAVYSILKK